MEGYICPHGVAALQRYKHSGTDRSYVANYILQPYWNRCVSLFPLWVPSARVFTMIEVDTAFLRKLLHFSMFLLINKLLTIAYFVSVFYVFLHISSPNMITLMGFILLVISAVLGCIYSPHLDSPPPRWVHFTHGLLLFLYQTFDPVDGKQARHTSSSSPLGELFDHGCDALVCMKYCYMWEEHFLILGYLSCPILFCNMGTWAVSSYSYSAFWALLPLPFFFTNMLILPEINGPTEGLMLIYVCHFFTFFVGAEWWAQDFRRSITLLSWIPWVPEIPLYGVVLFLRIIGAVVPTVGYNIYNVYQVVRAKKESILLALAMVVLSPSDIMRTQPHLLIVGTGFAFGYLVGRMILAHLCDEPKGLKAGMCMSLLFLPFAVANALTARLNNGTPLIDEFFVLLLFCSSTVSLYLYFATSVIHEITTALGIICFRITRKEA